MLNKKICKNLLIITFTLSLSACANSDELKAKIATLSNQVKVLSQNIAELKSQQQTMNKEAKTTKIAAQQAASDAKKTNQRIDNVIASYIK